MSSKRLKTFQSMHKNHRIAMFQEIFRWSSSSCSSTKVINKTYSIMLQGYSCAPRLKRKQIMSNITSNFTTQNLQLLKLFVDWSCCGDRKILSKEFDCLQNQLEEDELRRTLPSAMPFLFWNLRPLELALLAVGTPRSLALLTDRVTYI